MHPRSLHPPECRRCAVSTGPPGAAGLSSDVHLVAGASQVLLDAPPPSCVSTTPLSLCRPGSLQTPPSPQKSPIRALVRCKIHVFLVVVFLCTFEFELFSESRSLRSHCTSTLRQKKKNRRKRKKKTCNPAISPVAVDTVFTVPVFSDQLNSLLQVCVSCSTLY